MYRVKLGSAGYTHQCEVPAQAVGYMIEQVEEYLTNLSDVGTSVAMHHAEWEMFLDDLNALAAKPWLDDIEYKMIEGPGQVYWGWKRADA